MFPTIASLTQILASTVDAGTAGLYLMGKLRKVSANRIYVDLLDEHIQIERKRLRLDVKLDKRKMQQVMQSAAIDLKRSPLEPSQLDQALNGRIVKILVNDGVINGTNYLNEDQARAIVSNVHQKYFEKIVEKIPELVEVLKHHEITQSFQNLQFGVNDLLLQFMRHDNEVNVTNQRILKQQELIQHSQETQEKTDKEIHTLFQQILPNITAPNLDVHFDSNSIADVPPQFDEIYTDRLTVITKIFDALSKYSWVEIIGQTGSGKTGLASIVFNSSDYLPFWISFLGHEGADARSHLREQLTLINIKLAPKIQTRDFDLEGLVTTIGDNTKKGLIILDNLPDPADLANDPLYLDLCRIGISFSKRNIPILSTAQRNLPSNVKGKITSYSLDVPILSTNEITEMLKGAHATKFYLREQIIELIEDATKGLTALVSAHIRWYQRQNWPEKLEFLETILSEEPGADLRGEYQRKLYRLIEPPALELLSRLSLLISDFDSDLVMRVAQISENIENPYFVLNELKNIGISQLGIDRFQVSPLHKDIGKKNIPKEKQLEIASSVADFFLKERQPITIDNVFRITLYLWIASRQMECALFVTQALITIKNEHQAKLLRWAIHMPSIEIGFKDDVHLSMQIILRTQQFRVALLVQESISDIDKELDRLFARTSPEHTGAIIYAHVIINSALTVLPSDTLPYSFSKSIQHSFEGVRLFQENPMAMQDTKSQLSSDSLKTKATIFIPHRADIGEIVWFWVMKVNTQERALIFLEEIYNAKQEVLETIFGATLAASSMPYIFDQIWAHTENEPQNKAEWNNLLAICDKAINFATERMLPVLRVAASRAKAIIFSLMDENLDRAIPIIEAIPVTEDIDLEAWVHITFALLHNDYGLPENACIHLEKALALDCPVAEQWRLALRKNLIVVYCKLNMWAKAKQQASIVLKKTQAEAYPLASRLEILGELAFVYWNLNDAKRACGTLYGLYNLLRKNEQFTKYEFNEIYNKFSHAINWYATESHNSPIKTHDGQPYYPVGAGFFVRSLPNLRTYEHNYGNLISVLAIPLNLMAIRTDAHGIGWQLWEQFKNSQDIADAMFKHLTYYGGATLEARFGSSTDALKYGILAFKVIAFTQSEVFMKQPLAKSALIQIEDNWNKLSESQQTEHENLLLSSVFVPLFIDLISTKASKNQIISTLQAYRDTLTMHSYLHTYQTYQHVIDGFETLLLARVNNISVSISKSNNDLMDFLALLSVYDIGKNMDLRWKLNFQISIASFIWEHRKSYPTEQIMYGLGRIFCDFWENVIRTQRFLLIQPDLMEKRLAEISTHRSKKTVAEILRIAADGVGIVLDKRATDFI